MRWESWRAFISMTWCQYRNHRIDRIQYSQIEISVISVKIEVLLCRSRERTIAIRVSTILAMSERQPSLAYLGIKSCKKEKTTHPRERFVEILPRLDRQWLQSIHHLSTVVIWCILRFPTSESSRKMNRTTFHIPFYRFNQSIIDHYRTSFLLSKYDSLAPMDSVSIVEWRSESREEETSIIVTLWSYGMAWHCHLPCSITIRFTSTL